jgi:hypothetical protein
LRHQLEDNQREMELLERNWRQRAAGDGRRGGGSQRLHRRAAAGGGAGGGGSPIGSSSSTGTGADDESDSLLPPPQSVDAAWRRRNLPHIWNLNEDPVLSNVLVHFIRPGASVVGIIKKKKFFFSYKDEGKNCAIKI